MAMLLCSTAFGAEQKSAEPGVGLTIYNNDFAVVREARQMAFTQGINTVKFTDVASAIEPASVNFQCLSSPGTVTILEQNYEYDLVSGESLLKRYIDKDVTVLVKGSGADIGKRITGTLLAAIDNDLILKGDGGNVEIIDKAAVEQISLKQGPSDLVTKPTLVWLAQAKEKGSQLCQVTYTTGQIGWAADYSAVLNADETKLDFSGWVTITNNSGAGYKDAALKLIAGDVRRITPPQPPRQPMMMMAKGAGEAPAFEEKPFMEYHLYTLGRKTTVNNNEVKQIEFITPAHNVAAKKIYLYERNPMRFYGPTREGEKVQVKFEFENTQGNGLGIALPKGKVRVFKRDLADQNLEFVGEDEIDHTPAKEKLSLYIGDAFDITVQHTLVDSRQERRATYERHKIELRNRKKEAVTVFVDEKFPPWVNWSITDSTLQYTKRDATTARFEVKIDADSTATLEYRTEQNW